MEGKKIVYPFKTFVKNIIIGIILILSFFSIVPTFNSFKGDDANQTSVSAASVNIYVYGYFDNEIKELGDQNWTLWDWRGWFPGYWPRESKNLYTYGENDNRIYYTTDKNKTNLDGEYYQALGSGRRSVDAGYVKIIPQSGKGISVVGFFEGIGDFSSERAIVFGDSADLSGKGGKNITVLVTKTGYTANINSGNYLQVNDSEDNKLFAWESAIPTGNKSSNNRTLSMGGTYTIPQTSVLGSDSPYTISAKCGTSLSSLTNLDNFFVKTSYSPNSYATYSYYTYLNYKNSSWYLILKDTREEMNKNYEIKLGKGTFADNKSILLCSVYNYKLGTIENDVLKSEKDKTIGENVNKIQIQNNSVETYSNGNFVSKQKYQVVFDIYNKNDLEFFAKELKGMNAGVIDDGGSYKAVIKGTEGMSTSTFYFGNYSSWFKGEFDGGNIPLNIQFNSLDGAYIYNVHSIQTGSFVRSNAKNSHIKNCYSGATIIQDCGYIFSLTDSLVEDCVVEGYNVVGEVSNGKKIGAFVANSVNSTIKNCHVKVGSLSVSGVLLNSSAFGGFAGYVNGGKLENCSSKVKIECTGLKIDEATDYYSVWPFSCQKNNAEDYVTFGGMVGYLANSEINYCSYEVEGDITIKSGAIWDRGRYWYEDGQCCYNVLFGGLVGWVYNDNVQVNYTNNNVCIKGAVYIGTADKPVNYAYYGPAIGKVDGKVGIGKNYVFISSLNCTVQRTNNVWILGHGTTNEGSTLNNSTIYGEVNDKLYMNGTDTGNTTLGNLYDWQIVKNKNIVGYNSEIQKEAIDISGGKYSAPFVVGAGYRQKSYNVLIDCTQIQNLGNDEVTVKTLSGGVEQSNQGFVYTVSENANGYNVNRAKYVYGSAVNSCMVNGISVFNGATYKLPTIYRGNIPCSYYSIYPTGVDENGKASKFANPGELIGEDILFDETTNITIYPIFRPSISLYSATRLYLDGTTSVDENGTNVTSILDNFSGEEYTIYESIVDNRGLYSYEYIIIKKESKDSDTEEKLTKIPNDVINKLRAFENKAIEEKKASISDNSLMNELEKEAIEKTEDGEKILYYTLKYVSGSEIKNDNNFAKYTQVDGNDFSESGTTSSGKTLFYHVYKEKTLSYGTIITLTISEEDLAAIKSGNLVNVGGYDIETSEGKLWVLSGNSKFELVLTNETAREYKIKGENGLWCGNYNFGVKTLFFLGDLENGTKKVSADLSGINNVENFKDVSGYSATENFLFTEQNLDGLNELLLQDNCQKSSYGNAIDQGSEYYLNNTFYLLYQAPGIFLSYYDENGNIAKNERYDYANKIEKGNKVYFEINTEDYASVTNTTRYDFVGWTILGLDSNNNEISQFVFGKSTFKMYFPFSWADVVKIKLTPVFIEKLNEDGVLKPLNLVASTEISKKDYELDDNGNYKVATLEQLVYVAYKVNIDGKTNANITLLADIDFAGVENFIPIGFNSDKQYCGTFDGQGHIIKNLTISGKDDIQSLILEKYYSSGTVVFSSTLNESYVGLFGYVGNGNDNALKNVNLVNVNISGTKYVGGLVGASYAKISNILIQGSLASGTYAGSIAGMANGKTISECISKIDSVSATYFGSIAGQTSGVTIADCFDLTNIALTESGYVQERFRSEKYGIVGEKINTTIKNCYSNLYGTNDTNNNVYYGKYTEVKETNWLSPFVKITVGYTFDGNGIEDASAFITKANSNVWNVDDEINGRLPYLINTGIVKIKFIISPNNPKNYIQNESSNTSCVFTKNETENLKNSDNVTLNTDGSYILVKDYFILDTYSYDNNLAEGKLKTLNGTTFNKFAGYDFVTYLDNSGNEINLKEKMENEELDFFKTSGEYYLRFARKTIRIEYCYTDKTTGEEKTIDTATKIVSYGKEFEFEDIDLSKTFPGKYILGYYIYLPNDNCYLKIAGDRVERLDLSETNIPYYGVSAENGEVVRDKFVVSEIDTIEDEGQLPVMKLKINSELQIDVQYQLYFNQDKQYTETKPTKQTPYNRFDTSGKLVKSENGTQNKFTALYGEKIVLESETDIVNQGANIPKISFAGSSFLGWQYWSEKEVESEDGQTTTTAGEFKILFGTDVNEFSLADLRASGYGSTTEVNVATNPDGTQSISCVCSIQLYPKFDMNKYKIHYLDARTKKNTVTWDKTDFTEIYSENISFSEIFNLKEREDGTETISIDEFLLEKAKAVSAGKSYDGYKIVGFDFVDGLSNATNSEISNSLKELGYVLLSDEMSTRVTTHYSSDYYISNKSYADRYDLIVGDNLYGYDILGDLYLVCMFDRVDTTLRINVPNDSFGTLSYSIKTDGVETTTETDLEVKVDENGNYYCEVVCQYADEISICAYLNNGYKISKIEKIISGSKTILFNESDLTKQENYFVKMSVLGAIYDISMKSDVTLDYSFENLTKTTLALDEDGYYKISSADDLYSYSSDPYQYEKAKLVNNIDITGYKLSISYLSEENIFDGNYHTINGFTSFSTNTGNDIAFITLNYGTVKNLYFDNVCMKITNVKFAQTGASAIIGVIGSNVGTIENVHILGGNVSVSGIKTSSGALTGVGALAGFNSGIIRNCSVNANLSVSGSVSASTSGEPTTYAGLLVGAIGVVSDNAGSESGLSLIENVTIGGTLNLYENTVGSLIAGIALNGKIENVVVNATISKNHNSSVAAVIVGKLQGELSDLSLNSILITTGQKISGKDIDFVTGVNNADISDIVKINIAEFTYGGLKTQLEKNNLTNFVVAIDRETKSKKIVLKNNNNFITTFKFLTEKIVTEDFEIIEKIDGTELNNREITFVQALQNRLNFKTITPISKEFDYDIQLFYKSEKTNEDRTSEFDVKYSIDNGEFIDGTKIVQKSGTQSAVSNVEIKYFGKQITEYNHFFVLISKDAEFSAEELEKIKNGFKVQVGDQIQTITYFEKAQSSGISVAGYDIYEIKIDATYGQIVNVSMELPAFVKTDENNGIKRKNVEILENSTNIQVYSNISGVAGETMLTYNSRLFFYLVRSAIKLNIVLDVDNLANAEEKNTISLNENVTLLDVDGNEIVDADGSKPIIEKSTTKDGKECLIISINPIQEQNSGDLIYYLPKTIVNLINYENNGINYKLENLVAGKIIYYTAKNDSVEYGLTSLEVLNDLSLYTKFNSVEYQVSVILDEGSYTTNKNGYKITTETKYNTLTEKDENIEIDEIALRYYDSVVLPTIEKREYKDCYTFLGFTFKKYANLISEKRYSEIPLISDKFVLKEEYKILNNLYTENRTIVEGKESDRIIELIPVYEEKHYSITFNCGQNADEYKAWLEKDGNLEFNEETDCYELTLSLSISDVLYNLNTILPKGVKYHHKFIGFKNVLNDNEVITYSSSVNSSGEEIGFIPKSNNIFDATILTKDAEFVAVYEIDKVNVSIEFLDIANSASVNYEITALNDIENFEYEQNGNLISFSVDYNTTYIQLPSITLLDENYRYNGLKILKISSDGTRSAENYASTYKFTSDVKFMISCDYLIKYQTKFGTLSENYISTNNFSSRSDDSIYSKWGKFNEQVVLPTKEEVSRTSFELIGFKIDEVFVSLGDILQLKITKPVEVEFIYSGIIYSLEINTQESGAKILGELKPSEYIEEFIKQSEYKATIKVVGGTRVDEIKAKLYALNLTLTAKTLTDFIFSETTNYISQNGTITPQFVDNEYTINFYYGYNHEADKVYSITKKYNEEIPSSVFEEVNTFSENEASTNNSIFIGISLRNNGWTQFENLSSMPLLEKEFSLNNLVVNANKYTLNVYSYYIAQIQVTINAKDNSKIVMGSAVDGTFISNFQTSGYNTPTYFNITSEGVRNRNSLVLPLPEIKQNSVLKFATFKGYSIEIDSQKVIVVDANGKLLDNFTFANSIVLSQEFEFNLINFNLYATYDSVASLEDFSETNFGFTKQIRFGDKILKLPVIEKENYIFKGYYWSNSDSIVLDELSDTQISDENGQLLSAYAVLGAFYFGGEVDGIIEGDNLISIYAKYESIYKEVSIISENERLGTIGNVLLTDGTLLNGEKISGGYKYYVPSGNSIIISTNVDSAVATFDHYEVSGGLSVDDINSEITIVRNLTTDCTIVAKFNYIEFSISYFVDGEYKDLSPQSFNIDTETFDLPIYEKQGYNFEGWYLEKEFINKVDAVEKGTTTTNLALFGKLTNKKININVYSNNIDGYTHIQTISQSFNTTIVDLVNVSKDGYNFVGFNTKQDASGYYVSNGALSLFDDDINLYAILVAKTDKTLSGQGTSSSPYEISTSEDFVTFANLLMDEKYNNQKVYYKLINHIYLSENVLIKSFKANFNGNGYVIYANEKIVGTNELTSSGNVVLNISLFGENKGTISDLMLVVNQTSVNVYENSEINFGLISSNNIGKISNCIIYYNVSLTLDNVIEFSSVAIGIGVKTNNSVVSSVLSINGVETQENDVLDEHYHSKNVSALTQENNQYIISTEEEFANILTLNDEDKEIVLKNNLDLKGKLFEKISGKITIYGDGYIIKNLVLFGEDCLFENLVLNKTAIENVVFINLKSNGSLIKQASGISLSYIELAISNANSLIATNSGEIENSYFTSNETKQFVLDNQSTIANVWTIKLEQANLTNFENFVVVDPENINLTSFENFSKTIWFVDEYNIMSDYTLPKLIGVGNVVVEVTFDKDIMKINSSKYQLINNNLFIMKNQSEFVVFVEILSEEKAIKDVLVNKASKLDCYDANMFMYYKTGINYNTLEFVLDVKSYEVTIIVDTAGAGTIELLGIVGEKVTVNVFSGQELSPIITENEGYKFVGYSSNELESPITSNLVIYAKFEKLITYKLFLSDYENITVVGTLDERFVEVEENVFEIKITQLENIDDILPEIKKQNYVFTEYTKRYIRKQLYEVHPHFVADYVSVTLEYFQKEGECTIESDKYSQSSPELLIATDEGNGTYHILRNEVFSLNINFIGTYLTKILINDVLYDIDYSVYKDLDFASLQLSVSEDSTINIVFAEILVNTQFIFDSQTTSFSVKKGFEIDQNNVVSTRKGTTIQFALSIADDKSLDKFILTDENGEEFESEITFTDGYYNYMANKNATIEVVLKNKIITITVRSNVGRMTSDVFELTELDENIIRLEIEYGSSFSITLPAPEGYRLKTVTAEVEGKVTSIKVDYIIGFSNVTKDMFIDIYFEKLETWLDLDDNGQPTKFALTNFTGKGTKESPYIISSVDDFLTLAYNVNVLGEAYQNTYFKAEKRDMKINLSRYYFIPIGVTTNFEGTILGDNMQISGLKIYSHQNAGLFKILGQNALIKSITVDGTIEGELYVGSICGTNLGTILGCTSSCQVISDTTVVSEMFLTGIVGGICAQNNGKISRTRNLGYVTANVNLIGGICALNNGEVDNVYNTGSVVTGSKGYAEVVVAGLVAQNNGSVKVGYNNSTISNKNEADKVTIYGTVKDEAAGSSQAVYYNTTKLADALGNGKSESELKDKTNEIYKDFDLENIWEFKEKIVDFPVLRTMYEYLGSITFNIVFSEDISPEERLVLVRVSNSASNYCLALTNEDRAGTLENIIAGTYTITLSSVLGSEVSADTDLILILDETVGDTVTIKIVVTKTVSNGFYWNIAI